MVKTYKYLVPVIIVFTVITAVCLIFYKPITAWGVDVMVLGAANLLFFLLNVIVFLMQKKVLNATNPNVFVRSVIGGMMIKMFTCVIAVLAYTLIVGSEYNKKAVFISLFIYLFYLAAEVMAITKINYAAKHE